jgi:hypothetical protein
VTHQIPQNLHFASPLAKQNEKQNQSKKHKSSFVGETVAFSICNKPFKPLGLPSGRVKSREGLLEMIPINIETLCCQQERVFTQTMVHTSLACLKRQTISSTSTSTGDPTLNHS